MCIFFFFKRSKEITCLKNLFIVDLTFGNYPECDCIKYVNQYLRIYIEDKKKQDTVYSNEALLFLNQRATVSLEFVGVFDRAAFSKLLLYFVMLSASSLELVQGHFDSKIG